MRRLELFINAVKLAYAVVQAYYRAVHTNRIQYITVTKHPSGVPYIAVILATGREAWRVTTQAIDLAEPIATTRAQSTIRDL